MRFEFTDRLCDPDKPHSLRVLTEGDSILSEYHIPLSDEDVWNLTRAGLDRIDRKGLKPGSHEADKEGV